MVDIRQTSVPSQNLGINNKENTRKIIKFASFPGKTQRQNHPHAEMIADLCRDRVVTIGGTKFGIRRSEIGTRSIRLGAAMAMYLADVPVFSIMLIGSW